MAMINRDAKRMGLIDRWQVTIGDDGAKDDGARDDRARDDGARDDRGRVRRWYTAHSKASSGRMCEG
jgi:hypothetical protein